MKFISKVLASGFALASLAAFAERPDYNHFEAGYLRHRLDGGCVQDGFEIGGSAEVSDRVFVGGHYSDVESGEKRKDGPCGSSMLRGSVGLFGDFSSNSTFYGAMSGLQFTPKHGDSDVGWGLEGGFRSYIARGIEAHVAVGLMDVGPVNETYLSAGGVYWFSDAIGAYLDLSTTDEGTSGLALGARFSF